MISLKHATNTRFRISYDDFELPRLQRITKNLNTRYNLKCKSVVIEFDKNDKEKVVNLFESNNIFIFSPKIYTHVDLKNKLILRANKISLSKNSKFSLRKIVFFVALLIFGFYFLSHFKFIKKLRKIFHFIDKHFKIEPCDVIESALKLIYDKLSVDHFTVENDNTEKKLNCHEILNIISPKDLN